MKLLYTLLLLLAGLLISSHSIAQGSLAALDNKNGFKGHTFGSSISNFRGLSVDDNRSVSEYDESFNAKYDWYLDSKDLKPFEFKGKVISIGDLRISSPTYYFFDNRLMRIDYFAKDYEGKELVKLYKSLYGNPEVVNGKTIFGTGIVTYIWRGNKVNLYVTHCANPYQGSTVISGSKPNLPWFKMSYLSLPMLAEMKNVNTKGKNRLIKSRSNDL